MKSRHGISLVELLLVLSACGVILTLSTGLIERIMRAEMRARDSVRVEQTALRLANTFRRDAWRATKAELSMSDSVPGQVLRLSWAGSLSQEYRQSSDAVVRTTYDGQQILGRETFSFPEHARIALGQESPSLVTLAITSVQLATGFHADQRPHDAQAPPTALEVVARVGRVGLFQSVSPDFGGSP
jgi:hypothetical protein